MSILVRLAALGLEFSNPFLSTLSPDFFQHWKKALQPVSYKAGAPLVNQNVQIKTVTSA